MEVILRAAGTLKERRGSVMLHAALITIVMLMALAVALEISKVYTTINMLREKTDAAVLSVAAYNVANVYTGVRESDGSAREKAGETWSGLVDTEEVSDALTRVLDLQNTGGGLERRQDGKTVYVIQNLQTVYDNAQDGVLNFTTAFTAKVTITLAGQRVTVPVNTEVKTSYDPRFTR